MRRRSRRKRRQKSAHDQVELNMAAMLDMAFQLLAFFILTFQPSEIEAQIAMRMPNEKPVTESAVTEQNFTPDLDLDRSFLKLPIQVFATIQGNVERIDIGANELRSDSAEGLYTMFKSSLTNTFKMADFDGIELSVADTLRYECLMQIVDICSRQSLPSGASMTNISISVMK